MIYEVNITDLPSLVINGGQVVIISTDSTSALVRLQSAPSSFIEEFSESDLQTLLGLDKWKQPCISCGEV